MRFEKFLLIASAIGGQVFLYERAISN
jgi:hypothetical protein